jgi:catechol 2,3-dioxygenase-like lactoylglutathione lyase family enzyme
MTLPRLAGLKTYVGDLAAARDFWQRHFGLTPASEGDILRYELGDVVWEHYPGGRFCGTRGPHHAMPVFGIDDFSHARGYLLAHDIPIVFEELIPGLNLIIFLDPDSNPFELAQETDPGEWDIAQRKELRTKRRQDALQTSPIALRGITEITIYTHDITASVQFYRDVVGLPVGLSYFAHVHLAAENVAVVLRTTRWQCKAPDQLHGTEPVFAVPDLDALAQRLWSAGMHPTTEETGFLVRDPVGIRVHFIPTEG